MQSLMMISGLGILCWIFIRSRSKGRRKSAPAVITKHLKHNSNASCQPEQFSGTQSLGAPNDVLKWQVELHDLGRDIKAELDAKILAVRSVTKQYDEAATRLADLIRLADDAPPHAEQGSRISAASEKLRQAGWNEADIESLFMEDSSPQSLVAAQSNANA